MMLSVRVVCSETNRGMVVCLPEQIGVNKRANALSLATSFTVMLPRSVVLSDHVHCRSQVLHTSAAEMVLAYSYFHLIQTPRICLELCVACIRLCIFVKTAAARRACDDGQ